jgi:hypothetical protein
VKVDFGPLEIALPSPKEHVSFLQYWTGDQTCRADLVVIGRVKRQVCGLTSDESNVISDYYFTVEETVFSHASATRPVIGSVVVVTGLGGTVNLREGQASTKIVGLTDFEDEGRYLLFLKTALETVDLGFIKFSMNHPDDYELTGTDAAFVLKQSGSPMNIYRPLEELLGKDLSKLDTTSMINLVTSVARKATDCKSWAR